VDLHERLTTARPAATPGRVDPFAELKNRVHMAVISVLGPRLFNVDIDSLALREQVLADTRRHLAQETGISREDRERLANEIADDALGH
jgi:pilus assembly protein CpaF